MNISPEAFEAALLPQPEGAESADSLPAESTEAVSTDAKPAGTDEASVESTAPADIPAEETATEKAARERDEKGRFLKAAEKAKHKDATPADVPRINELTAKWRAAEKERDDYRQKWEAAQKPTPVAQKAPEPRQDAPEAIISDFADPEPQLQDFAAQNDPYAAWMRAAARWEYRKERHEEQQKVAEAAATKQVQEWSNAFNGRLQTFRQEHPDFDGLVQTAPNLQNPLLLAAIQLDENGPALLYHLLQQPDKLLELHFLTDGKPVNEFAVKTVQSLLKARASGAVTASPATQTRKTLPTPLKAVPSGPIARSPIEPGSDNEPVEAYIKRVNKEMRDRGER